MTTTTTSSTSPSQPTKANRDINELMSANDNGQSAFDKNKSAIIIGVVLIVVAIIGYGIYATNSEKSKSAYNTKIYQFETTTLQKFQSNATDGALAKEAVVGLTNLQKELGNYEGLFPVVLKTSDLLISTSQLTDAQAVLKMGEGLVSDDYARYLILSRQAVVFEDLNLNKEAITALEKMTSLKVKIFEGKTYLDLGRIHMKMGDKVNAEKNFKHVVEKAKNDAEFVKMAQLYLSKL
jgi:predicted negative regulator of RcsB-dependent stress response